MNKKLRKESGQSILEVVFSIGVIALVVTGSILLIINSVSLKNKSFQRKKADEMAVLVVEDLINQKKHDGVNFWSLEDKSGESLVNFDNFEYSIEYNDVATCNNCTNATVTISWDDSEELVVNRFFSREVN